MGGLTGAQRAIIAKLGLDTTEFKSGYEKARAIQTDAQQQMQLLDAQRQRLRAQLETEYSASHRAEEAIRLSVTKENLAYEIQALAGKTGAQRAAGLAEIASLQDALALQKAHLAGYSTITTQVSELGTQYRLLSATTKEAGVAAAGFKEQALATGAMKNPFGEIISQLGLMVPGLGMIQGRLGAIFSTLTLMGGGIQGGSGAGLSQMAASEEAAAVSTGFLASTLPLMVSSLALVAGAGIAAAFTFTKIGMDAGEAAHAIELMSQKTGIATSDLQSFQAMGKLTGLSLEDVLTAQRRLSAAITGQATVGPGGELIGGGTSKGPAVLAALEIPTRTATGAFRDVKGVIEDLAEVFEKLPDGAEKSRIAIEVFGRSGLSMIPLLNLGKQGMKELHDTFGQYLPDLSTAADLHRKLDIENAKWDIAMSALRTNIAENVLPTLVDFIGNLNVLAGIQIQGGSVLEYLMTGKASAPGGFDPNANQNIISMAKAIAGPKPFQLTPGAADQFRELVQQQQTPFAAAGQGGVLAPDVQARVDSMRNQFLAAAAQVRSGREAQRAALPGGGAGLPPLPPVSQEEIAVQILINQNKIKTVDLEKQESAAMQEKQKRVQDVLAGTKSKVEFEEQAQQKSLALAAEYAKGQDAELASRERSAGSMKGYAAAVDFLATAEEKINDTIAGRDEILRRLGFKSAEQAKALFTEMSAPGTLPSEVPGMFQKAGVPFPGTKEGGRDLAEALKLTQQGDALRSRQEASLAIVQRGTDEYFKQNAAVTEQNAKIDALEDKQQTEVTLSGQLLKAKTDLVELERQQAFLIDARTRTSAAAQRQTAIAESPDATVAQRAAAMSILTALREQELSLGRQLIAVDSDINKTTIDRMRLQKELTAQISAGHAEEIKGYLARQQETTATTMGRFNLGLTAPVDSLKQLTEQQDALQVQAGSLSTMLEQLAVAGDLGTDSAKAASPAYRELLKIFQELDAQSKKVAGDIKVVEKTTGMGGLIRDLGTFSKIASSFGGGISKMFTNAAAGFEVQQQAMKNLGGIGDVLKPKTPTSEGGGIGEALKSFFKVGSGLKVEIGANLFAMMQSGFQAASGGQGIMGIFSGAVGMGEAGSAIGKGLGKAIGGSAGSAIAAAGGPIGAAVGAVMGIVGLAKQSKQRKAAEAIARVEQAITVTMQKFQAQQINLVETLRQLEDERQQIIAATQGGKKGNAEQSKKDLNQLNSQIISLQQQQKQILDKFATSLATFRVPPGVQSYAATLADVAKQLKDAAGAGATLAQQTKFLDDSMAQLKITIGKDLNSEEQKTVDLMRQSIDLVMQRAQLVRSEAMQERQIRVGLGQAVALTPAQQAAQQLRDIRQQTAVQLAAIDEQQANVKAQLDGQMQLFGWTQKDLDATDAKTKLIALQLDLQKKLTLETVNQIQAQMVWYAQLSKGLIPNLPPGYLPSSILTPVALPNTYNMPNAQIVLNINGSSGLTPDQIAQLLRDALAKLNASRASGLPG